MGEMGQYANDELHRLDKHKIKVMTDTEDGDCEVEADLNRITQVMKNLINNAIKFTERGFIRIGWRKGSDKDNFIVFVHDTGIGIAPEHSRVIFDQFRQIDGSNTRKYGGTGLGLAICRNLVQMMGGRIWVDSEPGKGSNFQVELSMVAPANIESGLFPA